MEAIDQAFQIFSTLLPTLEMDLADSITEEDVRFRAINRILTDVLGWEHGTIKCEKRSGKGFADYVLRIGERSVLVVEAKRDQLSLGLSSVSKTRAYRMDGPVFKEKPLLEGLFQAIEYSAFCGNELAVVSNGKEWAVFRSNRHADGRSILEGQAFCFGSLNEVRDNFKLFYELLSPENIKHFVFREIFIQQEGIHSRQIIFRKSLREEDTAKIRRGDALNRDLFSVFFKEMSGDDDPEMVAKCFVRTDQSEAAEQKISHIASEMISKIKSLDTDESQLLVDRLEIAKESSRREFIILIGNKGAGKSTFLDRFFGHVLEKRLLNELIVTHIDLKKSSGSENQIIEWLDVSVRDALEEKFFKDGIPTYDELLGIFHKDYKYFVEGPFKFQHERNKEEFKEEFGKFMHGERITKSADYVKKILRVIVASRKKLPVLIFDNADHFSIQFQERAFQYARALYENEVCLIIVPISSVRLKTEQWQLVFGSGLFESEPIA